MEPITIAALVVVLGLGTYAAWIAAIIQYEKPKPAPVLTLAWVHEGLAEPPPFDRRLLIPPPLTAGGATGAWPMIWELRKDTPALAARERFDPGVIDGEIVPTQTPAIGSKPWSGKPTITVASLAERDLGTAARAIILAGERP